MASDPHNWDSRYRREAYPAGTQPAALLRETLPMLRQGLALDLAMGAGRNAVFLAENGWRVVGIDSSRAALESAEALARARGVTSERLGPIDSPAVFAAPRLPGVLLIEGDLERCTLPKSQFDLVLCFNYLDRGLFAPIASALLPGGTLLYETYTVDQLAFSPGPHNPDHLLHPNELREAFPGLQTVFYREFRAGKGIASLLARKPRRH